MGHNNLSGTVSQVCKLSSRKGFTKMENYNVHFYTA